MTNACTVFPVVYNDYAAYNKLLRLSVLRVGLCWCIHHAVACTELNTRSGYIYGISGLYTTTTITNFLVNAMREIHVKTIAYYHIIKLADMLFILLTAHWQRKLRK